MKIYNTINFLFFTALQDTDVSAVAHKRDNGKNRSHQFSCISLTAYFSTLIFLRGHNFFWFDLEIISFPHPI